MLGEFRKRGARMTDRSAKVALHAVQARHDCRLASGVDGPPDRKKRRRASHPEIAK